jgi:hypothetical protein
MWGKARYHGGAMGLAAQYPPPIVRENKRENIARSPNAKFPPVQKAISWKQFRPRAKTETSSNSTLLNAHGLEATSSMNFRIRA